MRIGQGYDVHRFSETIEATEIRLGGVDVPSDRAILAHSDGDVVLHALCDALLGALALGDIGAHFPDSDDKYKDINSMFLVSTCIEMVVDHGYRLSNIDLTVIAQKPRVSPYRAAMQRCIADTLGVGIEMVNIKATTTEGLGFTGRAEGIAALAIVLLEGAHDK